MFDGKYHIFKDYEISFDEKGSTVGTVRKVQWYKDGEEPDESKAKIEIRKVYTSGAEERTGKGYTFSTPEGPGELITGLLHAGFGDTKDVLKAIKNRDDFVAAVKTIDEDPDDSFDGGEMFDMRDLLLNISTEDSSDDEDEEEIV